MKDTEFLVDREFITEAPSIVEAIMDQFDRVWMAAECNACDRRQYCGDPPDH